MFHDWILIGLLAVSTYFSRIIGTAFMAGRELGPALRRYFDFLPIAIITSLILKQMIIPVNNQLTLSIPVLIGSLVTAVILRISSRFLPSLLTGMLAGILIRMGIG
ncbi:AzlD domain-containing protein [Sediminibacillus dalangtanensis]|uniref:AzlD domain-containing protein n=1 Tax=Sediminibacillus dalangtanensis TaxID=2729421 RepID=A0ABX7VTG9_9BACI|nr:AzlD domain-containing protein [Sediminibacillus dalangtanensis]QTM99100.1 AzlD domain-containing protein [Sediminibacillus dalangtanensis]